MQMPLVRVTVSLYLLFLPVWFLMSLGVVMAAANSQSSWAGVAILIVLGYPIAILTSALAGRSAERAGRLRVARAWSLLPAPWMVAGGSLLAWAMWS